MNEQFGKYELIRRIGIGGMAEVFVARTRGAGGFVKHLVLKRILPTLNQDPEFVRMFVEEARLAAKLHHANIVQIFDFDQIDGTHFIAMEWVEGADLKRVQNVARRRGRSLGVDFAVHVGVEVLKGLHYAHSRVEEGAPLQLIHRDISPHNLLVSFSGEVKITDFGIAKVAALSATTATGTLKGKLQYMSPEQAGGKVLDHRSDLYSLGVVLWELLSGQRPYQANSERELMAQVAEGKIASIGEAAPDLPQGLVKLLDRLLETSVERRFENAAEALADLSSFAEVGESLKVAEFVSDLLPDEANRQLRGKTEALAGDGVSSYREATPHEETSGRRPDDGGTASLESLSDSISNFDSDGEGVPRRVRTGSFYLIRFLQLLPFAVVGLFGGWAAMIPDGPQATDSKVLDAVSLRVESSPSGLPLWLDGRELGEHTPVVIEGIRGRKVFVEVRRGKRSKSQAILMGQRETVLLALDATPEMKNAGVVVSVKPATPISKMPEHRKTLQDKAKKRRSSPTRVRRQRGWLSVYVDPWARIYLDGKGLGLTPIKKHLVTSGRHELLLVNPDLGRRVRKSIEVRTGAEKAIRVNWTR